MTSVGVGYDQSAATYSPAGRVFQVEYAEKAVKSSGTIIGIKCKDGVVLAVEKLIHSKMLVKDSFRRIFSLSKHSGLAIGGVQPDGRQLVNRGREECLSYKQNFGISIPGKILSRRLSLFVQAYTEYGHLRPFGVASLLSCYDSDGPQLYMIEPSGICYKYFGIAVGKGEQAARVELEKLDFDKMTSRKAAIKLGEIIYSIHDEVKDKPFELEMSWICDESNKLHTLVPKEVLEQANLAGKKAQEDEESESEDEEETET